MKRQVRRFWETLSRRQYRAVTGAGFILGAVSEKGQRRWRGGKSAMFRIIVAGSRDFTDYAFVASHLDRLLSRRLPHVQVVSGACRGVDSLGECYARERGLPCVRFPADWSQGRAAGPVRNRAMAEAADACVVFSSGGPGSRDMRRAAESRGLLLRVIPLPGG
jgi:hypothetical protein